MWRYQLCGPDAAVLPSSYLDGGRGDKKKQPDRLKTYVFSRMSDAYVIVSLRIPQCAAPRGLHCTSTRDMGDFSKCMDFGSECLLLTCGCSCRVKFRRVCWIKRCFYSFKTFILFNFNCRIWFHKNSFGGWLVFDNFVKNIFESIPCGIKLWIYVILGVLIVDY